MDTAVAPVEHDPGAVRAAFRAVQERFPGPREADVDDAARLEATLTYVWDWVRTGVLVCVRDGRLRLFLPFCNLEFRNDFDLDVPAAITAAEDLPRDRWWANATLLCTRQPCAAGWTLGPLPAYRAMIEAALRRHYVPRATVVLNRRDAPILRLDGSRPFRHAYRAPPGGPVRAPGAELPVLSPFSDPDIFADRLVPTHACWEHRDLVVEAVPWERREARALFRGSATNPLRTELCAHFARDRLFDAALTRTKGGRLWADGGRVERTAAGGDAAAFLPPEAWTRYRVVLAVDGHSALNRWSALARSGAYVVRVAGSEAGRCALDALVAHEVVDGRAPDWKAQLRRVVARLVRRKRGPPPRDVGEERICALVAGALAPPCVPVTGDDESAP